jgi:DNA invertase Pin-like site-specific DNA recombinase
MIIGYARVSSRGQSLDVQLDKLTNAGAERIYQEKASGKSSADRGELQSLLAHLRPNDVVLCTRLDRIARSTVDLLSIVKSIEGAGAGLRFTDQPEVDTTTPQGKLFVTMLGAIAEFERELMLQRQRDGIDKALADVATGKRGRWGPKVKWSLEALQALVLRFDKAPVKKDLAVELGVSRQQLYRLVSKGRKISKR